MKILITVPTYRPLKDGVQNITTFYAEKLVAFGNDLTILTSNNLNTLPNSEKINGVNIKRINIYTKKSINYGDINKFRSLFLELASQTDVLINVCTQTATTDCISDLLSSLKCIKIIYLHGMAHYKFPNVPNINLKDILSWLLNITIWKKYYKTFNFNNYDMAIHLHKNDNTLNVCKKKGLVNNIILENGSTDGIFEPKHKNSKSPLVYVSNYSDGKNQEFALRSYYRSNSTRDLIFIGSKDNKYFYKLNTLNEKLKKRTKKSKNVLLIFNQQREETNKILSSSFALLMSSKSEKYSVVIAEAMKAKVLCISTDCGITKYLPGVEIIRNVKEMAFVIDKYENDIENYNLMVDKAFNYALNNQNMDENAKYLNTVLNNLVNTSKSKE